MIVIRKSDERRLEELEIALKSIEINVGGFHKTKDKAYLLSLKQTLRALITLGGNNMTPLLIDLSSKFNIPLQFYSYAAKSEDNMPKGLAASIIASKSWSISNQGSLEQYVLEEWLESNTYFISRTSKCKNRNQVLKRISNTEASHYDEDVDIIVDELERQFGLKGNGMKINDDKRIIELDKYFDELHMSMM